MAYHPRDVGRSGGAAALHILCIFATDMTEFSHFCEMYCKAEFVIVIYLSGTLVPQ